MAITPDRVREIFKGLENRHGAQYIASADMSCLLHMKSVIDRLKLPLKVIRIAQDPERRPPMIRGLRSGW
jgi:Fe-S oxidoreductase